MKPLLIALTFVFTTGLTAELSAQSLADMAKQEKERRAKVTSDTKVITNNDRVKGAGSPETEALRPPSNRQGGGSLRGEAQVRQAGGR